MRTIEKGLFLMAVVSIVLRVMLVPGAVLFTTLSLLSLACLYIICSFALLNGIRLRDIFKRIAYQDVSTLHILGAIVTGFALSLACVAIVFGLLFWPGRSLQLFVSIPPLLAVLVISIVKRWGTHREFYIRIVTRVPVALAMCLFLFLFPRKTLVQIFFRDRPALIEAINNSMDHPGDYELEKKKSDEFHNNH